MKKCKSVSVSSPEKKVANRSPLVSPALAAEEEEEAEMASLSPSRTSSGFGIHGGIATGENVRLRILIGGGTGTGADAGAGEGDGDNGDGDGGGGSGEDENWDWYYQKMISKYPGEALLLGNYAKFLKARVFVYKYVVMLLKRKNTVREQYWFGQEMGMCCPCMKI